MCAREIFPYLALPNLSDSLHFPGLWACTTWQSLLLLNLAVFFSKVIMELDMKMGVVHHSSDGTEFRRRSHSHFSRQKDDLTVTVDIQDISTAEEGFSAHITLPNKSDRVCVWLNYRVNKEELLQALSPSPFPHSSFVNLSLFLSLSLSLSLCLSLSLSLSLSLPSSLPPSLSISRIFGFSTW